MLPEQYRLLQKLQTEFEECRDEVVEACDRLWGAKGDDYDVETGIWDRAPFDEFSFAHEVYKITLRLVEMMKNIDEEDLKFEGIDEKVYDLINYAIAWGAYRKMKRRQEEIE